MTQKDQIANFRNSSIAVSSKFLYDLDAKDLTDDNGQRVATLTPFRNVTIFNDSAVELKVFLNNRRGYDLIPANTIFQKKDDRIVTVEIENTSALATGSYFLTLDSQESELSILKGILTKMVRG